MKKTDCKSCKYCKSIYRGLGYRFSKSKWYYCEYNNKIICDKQICNNWQEMVLEYDLSDERFKEVENALIDLQKLFEE